MTRQLLLFSRGRPPKPEIADLNQVVVNFEKMLRRLIGEDVDLVVKLAAQPLRVLADIGQVEQVIMNLAANARDAMPRGGRLTLETGFRELHSDGSEPVDGEASVRYVELAVIDTGVGMDQETIARLFEPFFTTKDIHHGTGLGLSVTYGIVKSHKGHLKVESWPDQGSVFRVYLPLTEALPDEVSAPARLAEPPLASATILLVEDNADVRLLMREILSGAGYGVLEASSVSHAMDIGQNHPGPIDLLVSDIVMPGFSGLELGKRLTAIRPGMSVLYVSGYSDREVASRTPETSQVAYLQKPFAANELMERVAATISRSKKANQ